MTFAKIANNAVGTAKIANNAVTTAKIADNAVNSSKIADGAVGTSDLADGSVTLQKINPAGSSSGQVLTSTGTGVNWQNSTLTLPFDGTTTVSPGFSITNSQGSIAIRGRATNAAGINYGGYFEAYGDTGRGVAGAANGANSIGVYGQSTGTYGVGVKGYSTKSDGVVGQSITDWRSGVYGVNSAINGFGVYGRNTSPTGNDNIGYLGGGLYGVYGSSSISSTTAAGVYGVSAGTDGSGVVGEANTGTMAYGVWGKSTSGYGGVFEGATIGISARVTGTGTYAAEFRGNVIIRSKASGLKIMELGEGLDYAEGFHVTDKTKINAGSVLIIDPEHPGKLALSDKPYDTKVAGIAADANGIGSGVRLGAGEFDIDVAMAGRVYCNVDATEAGVEPGDLLTTSSTPGHAMKAGDYARAQGAILGKAMERLEKGKKGQVLVLVTLQ